MPGPLPHIRQVHRGDPIGHLAHTPQVVALDTGRGSALLDLAGLIQRPELQARRRPAGRPPHPARPPRTAAPRPSPRTCPTTARLSSRWVRSGARSPTRCAIVHPLRLGRSLARPRGTCPPAATAPPHKARLQQPQQFRHASGPPATPLSWRQQPPSVLLLSRTHDREAAAPVEPAASHAPPLVKPQMDVAVLGRVLLSVYVGDKVLLTLP